jgi:hypothetical protein
MTVKRLRRRLVEWRWRFLDATIVIALASSSCSSPSSDANPAGAGGAAGTTTTGGAGLGGTGPGSTDGDWCGAQAVLRDNCQGCHGPQPLFGAPMRLVTFDDLHARSVTSPDRYVYELVKERIHDVQKPMPPLSANEKLSAIELATLDTWLAGGAKLTSSTCGTGGSGGTGGNGGGDAGPLPPGDGDWPSDCEQRFTLRAHGASEPGDMTKFNVSAAPTQQFYQCFTFKVPWGADAVQALRFRSSVDDARVVHHWLLYGSNEGTGPDGQVGGSGCGSGRAALLAGWAPGFTETVLPSDVGLLLPSGENAYMGLEVHYNNTAGYPDALDASGVEVCVTKKFRPKTAGVHWLGSAVISLAPRTTQDVVGVCDPVSTEPIHILSIWPHMHKLGTHSTIILNRLNGTKETLHDAPFSFEDQRSYSMDVTLNDGDTIKSTCRYNNTTNNPVTFGPATENEMCFNFVTAWPLGALSSTAGGTRCFVQTDAGSNRP